MARYQIPNVLLLVVSLALASGIVASQPISPTSDLKSNAASDSKGSAVDLPYKPDDSVVPTQEVVEEAVDPNTPTDAAAAGLNANVESKKYNFDNIPFLALKYPVDVALPDPQY